MHLAWTRMVRRALALIALLALVPLVAWSQQFSKADRALAHSMLRDAAEDVQKYYYDPKLHGVDWDAKVRQAKQNIDKADSVNGAVSEIAALLDTLNDSHTSLTLPPRNYTNDYGFRMKMFGERCYVFHVRAKSDAEKKGLKPGDEVLAVNELPVSRKSFWRIEYIYNRLRPQPGLRLTLRDDDGSQRQVDVMAKIQPAKVMKYAQAQGINQIVRDRDDRWQYLEPRYLEKGDGLLVVRVPEFTLSATAVDDVLGKMRKHTGVVVDLRGNPGGFVPILDRFLGGMFENNLKICDRVSRTSTKPISVTGHHHGAYTGRLVVLVDSESASASEMFARVVQLERRAFVVGDRTSGKVMESKFHSHEIGVDWLSSYGVSVTEADLIMNDGKSLEHVGVEPDIAILPTAQDLANSRDPVLAKAAGLVGAQLSPEEAGAAFPYIEPADQ